MQFFDKNECFHHLSEQISTFIHRKPKLTFAKNMVATGHITAVAKMNPSYLPGGANVHPPIKCIVLSDYLSRPVKIRTDGVHARVRELGSIDFSTLQLIFYAFC